MPRTKEQIDRMTPRLQPHQERVIHEHADLAAKVAALEGFLRSPAFKDVEEAERLRLMDQFTLMHAYAEVLVQRIVNFKSPAQRSLPKETKGDAPAGAVKER